MANSYIAPSTATIVGAWTRYQIFKANPPTFHFALVSSPTVWTQHVGELNFDCVAESGTVPCYIRAATSGNICNGGGLI